MISPVEPGARILGAPELGVGEVAGKAARGAVALGARQIAITGTNLVGGVVLARLLSPGEFGVYAVVAFLVAALNVFGDGGLGVSLIRQQAEPSKLELRAVFTAQQAVIASGVVVGAVIAPFVVRAFSLGGESLTLVWLFLGAVLITSFQVVPAIRLERSLAFGRIGTINVVETLTFTGSAIVLAGLGHGALSFGIAALVQAVVGTSLMFVLAPWPIGWAWRPDLVRHRLRFGVPYQGIAVVSFIKDSITPVLIGLLLGAAQVGYVKWSQALAAQLLIALMALDRVYFPAFARLQSRPDELRRLVEAAVRVTNMLTAPVAVLVLIYAGPVTDLVYGEKWRPALPVFYWLCAANLVVPTVSPMFSLLNALGRSRSAFGFAVLWMVATWGFGVPLILIFGMVGFGIANCMVQATNYWVLRSANRGVDADLLDAARKPWLLMLPVAGAAMCLRVFVAPTTLVGLAIQGGLGLVAYVALVLRFDGPTIRQARYVITKGGR